MRIISGNARGRTLAAPKDDRVRPTTDRIRESLFSILGSFDECTVFDGFAGTGALGCEALSRGATRVAFADSSPRSIELVRENIQRVDGLDRSLVLPVAFDRALALLDFEPDVVFIDPPYLQGLSQQALETMARSPQITDGSLVVCEQHVDEQPCAHEAFLLDDERVYGSVRLRFLLRKENSV